jgi:hypothetical protein
VYRVDGPNNLVFIIEQIAKQKVQFGIPYGDENRVIPPDSFPPD